VCTGGTCQCPESLHPCDGVCRECCRDADCGGATPRCCDGVCRGCCGDADCATGQRCQAKRCVCAEAACQAAGGCCEENACNLDAPQWRPETTFGSGPGTGDDQFSNPFGVAVDGDGDTVWVAERGNARVSIWTESGGDWRNETTFGSGGSGPDQFDTAIDVAVSNDGKTAWIADIQNHRVSVWEKVGGDWVNQTTFGSEGTGSDQFRFPGGVGVGNNGRTVWVADTFNNRVSVWKKIRSRWVNLTTFGSQGSGPGQLSLPGDVAVSADGKTAWVADSDNDRISVWTESGGVWSNQTTFGSSGSGRGQLNQPESLDVSSDGRTVWVSDFHNNRISVWEQSGGDWVNRAAFGAKGDAADQFSFPNGVAASGNGRTVWVADSGNERVSVWARGCPPR
jgi:DNA-binding beta-propeller fold protein YncE